MFRYYKPYYCNVTRPLDILIRYLIRSKKYYVIHNIIFDFSLFLSNKFTPLYNATVLKYCLFTING